MIKAVVAGLLMAAAGAGVARPALAQTLAFKENPILSHLYVAGGIGAGFFTPTCDTGCVGDRLNANSILLFVGWPVTPRVRVEFGAQRVQSTSDTTGATGGFHASGVSLGMSVYPTNSLFVRGGVTKLGLGAPDAAGAPIEGSGGPGFAVGAGYDFFVVKKFAITPYVSFFGGSINKLEYFSGVSTIPTSGSVAAFHGGVLFSYRPWPRR